MSEILKSLKNSVFFPRMRKFGQITIDANFRNAKGIKEGDEFCIVIIPMKEIMAELTAEEILQLRHPEMVASS